MLFEHESIGKVPAELTDCNGDCRDTIGASIITYTILGGSLLFWYNIHQSPILIIKAPILPLMPPRREPRTWAGFRAVSGVRATGVWAFR